jgi:hypothetical protein
MEEGGNLSSFSLHRELIQDIFKFAKPLGHHEDKSRDNLGFGFIYYGMVRALRPKHIVVIGSGFGFSVVCLALGLKDNGEGSLSFVDPSFSLLRNGPFNTVGGRARWEDPEQTAKHFGLFDIQSLVTHHKSTSAEFFLRYEELSLPPVNLAFIDGNHSYMHVKTDFLEVLKRSKKNTYILLHDTNIYMRELIRHAGVKRWFDQIGRDRNSFEAVNFPFSSGVAIVRVIRREAWKALTFQNG